MFCGYSFKRNREFPIKKIIILGIIIAVVVIGIIFIFNYNNIKPLTEKEKAILTAIENYKTILKNPELLQVHQARYQVKEEKTEIYLEVSAQNGFGGLNRNVVKYKDNSYYGNTSQAGKTTSKYTSTENSLEIIFANIVKSNWDEISKDDSTIVNINKINKQLNKKL